VKKHSVLFSGKLGNLPCKPVHPKLTDFWMQKRFIQHLCPILYDIINRKQLIVEIYKMTEVHLDLIGPWIILQRPSKSPKLSATSDVKQPLQVLALTMINPSTNLLELIVVLDKESRTVAHAFDRSWLCCYPRPLICLHDKGTEFIGIEFQELLQSYRIKAVIVTTANPQTNAILECTHQVIANQLRSLCLMSIKLNSLADIQHELLTPVQWAMNRTYHSQPSNQCNPRMHPSSNCKSTPIPSLDVHQTELFG
jgi:hypothetical protein